MGRRKQASVAKIIPPSPATGTAGSLAKNLLTHPGLTRRLGAVDFFGSSLPSTHVVVPDKTSLPQDPLAPRELDLNKALKTRHELKDAEHRDQMFDLADVQIGELPAASAIIYCMAKVHAMLQALV